MSQITEIQLALIANVIFIPVENHINLVYIGLAIVFSCVLLYWFLYNKRH